MKGTVLIVDEDAQARAVAESLLQSVGVAVRSATDGTTACEIFRCDRAAIMVLVVDLDPAVSGMNGWELLRVVQGRFGGLRLQARPQILAVSHRAEPAVERFARRLGAHAFFTKPIAPRPFIAGVTALMVAHARAWRGSGAVAVASGGGQ